MDFDNSGSLTKNDNLASSQSDFHGFSSIDENISTIDDQHTEIEESMAEKNDYYPLQSDIDEYRRDVGRR